VILMTGYADREDLGEADQDFLLLNKPVSMRDLLAKVRQALEDRRKAAR
jgi:DNA-binding NtrC family response regulator